VIITTPELLWVGVLHKIFFRRDLYYDVLENYYWNIIDSKTYPVIIRSIIGSMVRLTELFTSPFVDKFFLAEKRYSSELSFAKPHIVLQNKLPKVVASKYDIKSPKTKTDLLFTGTLSENTGMFDAIHLATELHERDAAIRLSIVGYGHRAGERKRLLHEIENKPFITLVGGDHLVPHSEVMHHIAKSDFGILIYPPNLGTFTSIPTKLFEYLALRLPILARHNPETHELVEKYDAGLVLPFSIDYEKLLSDIKNRTFQFQTSDDIYWENESKTLISSLS
jgi:glycosyltransferase involved in cell wall biosynthesis